MPGLGTSFGRGGATTAQWDLANAQAIVIEGSNMAENHPVAFRFVMQAKERGATIIHVDPRFSRTSAMSDLHVAIRPGTDIAWLGGLIRQVMASPRWTGDPFFREYVVNYTNAAAIVSDDFQDTDDLDGLFSGFDEKDKLYRYESWQYRGHESSVPFDPKLITTEPFAEKIGLVTEPPPMDPTLADPRCVFQIVKRHYARYTPEVVERTCGIPADLLGRVAETLVENSGREKTTAWCYAVGWTQHTVGVQIIRAASVLQLLLGNIGRPGGGILALRGHATIQGSTDISTLYNLLPGYITQPHAKKPHETLHEYMELEHCPTGWWANSPKYIVSLLKAWYGERATADTDYAFHLVPRISGDHSQLPMTVAIHDGEINGLFVMGQNPAVGGHNAGFVRRGLAALDWMVVRDAFESETASFWYASPEVRNGTLDPHTIKTEVFLVPAALPGEKAGSFTNTHRLVQWHDKAVEPPGDARSEPWFLRHLGRRLKDLYATDPDRDSPRVRQILDLTWDYPLVGRDHEPDVEAILAEINGYRVADRSQVKDYKELQADGTTACGCWIYSGVMPERGKNLARNRKADPVDGPGTHLNWGFAWPGNRRILYNRASADPDGRPWSEKKKYVWWDANARTWTGLDTPDFQPSKPPDYEPDWTKKPKGMDALSGKDPFIMMSDGKGWLYVPHGLRDGPLPTHYEPVESPVENALYRQQSNPMAKRWPRPDNPYHAVADPAYPYVITTYRLTEHHTSALMSRAVPWLAELQPEGFVEMSPELAADKGVATGDWVTVWTARGSVEARALVTSRMRPLRVGGRVVHVVGMPWHFGWQGLAEGDPVNDLSAIVADPNVSIHEGKVFTCNLRRSGAPKRLPTPPNARQGPGKAGALLDRAARRRGGP